MFKDINVLIYIIYYKEHNTIETIETYHVTLDVT